MKKNLLISTVILFLLLMTTAINSQTWEYKADNGGIYTFENLDGHCGNWYQNNSYMGIYCGDTEYLIDYNKVRWLLGGAWNADLGTVYGMFGNNSLIMVVGETGLQYELTKVTGKKKRK